MRRDAFAQAFWLAMASNLRGYARHHGNPGAVDLEQSARVVQQMLNA